VAKVEISNLDRTISLKAEVRGCINKQVNSSTVAYSAKVDPFMS
jgi:hypothetical protein